MVIVVCYCYATSSTYGYSPGACHTLGHDHPHGDTLGREDLNSAVSGISNVNAVIAVDGYAMRVVQPSNVVTKTPEYFRQFS